MTVIACKDGLMAADSGVWHGEVWMPCKTKLRRLPDGSIVGAAGWKPVFEEWISWYEAGADPGKQPPAPKDDNDLDVIILNPDRTIWNMGFGKLWRNEWPIAAAGSHSEFVLGALLAGMSAPDAVALAIAHLSRARGPMTSMGVE